ncbi:hypothetical protein KIN20_035055 [Parelaphostrongylus tenuis]|uniref:7TM GPCR serpentine receptor class x (Srx) domain-containing protein n=1 Tax=Parelaphostrongylus tenuis TaxID=148309 RepID=A0AAD5RAK4_PARTN|nr:hypothetical protein KIN20_035055 [Parelaphostrongylus tenuis]
MVSSQLSFNGKGNKWKFASSKQTVYQNALFLYPQISYYCIRPLIGSKWGLFFTETFLWELCYGLDGFIMVLFHFRLSQINIKTAPTIPPTVGSCFVPLKS